MSKIINLIKSLFVKHNTPKQEIAKLDDITSLLIDWNYSKVSK